MCVYFCSTYYKAVRKGGLNTVFRFCEDRGFRVIGDFLVNTEWGEFILAAKGENKIVGISEIKLCSKIEEMCVKTFFQNCPSPPLPRTAIGLAYDGQSHFTTPLVQQ